MNRDIIERLAIDSVMGELNEDAEALFRSYLDGRPQARQWAEDVRKIYSEAETAFQIKTTHADAKEIAPGMRAHSISWAGWLPIVRWAAVIALGALIGFTVGRWKMLGNPNGVALHESSRDVKPVETVSDLKRRYAGTFWGDKVLALLEHKPRLQYETDLHSVKSWDTYRQYMKEKHNE
jgi:hypothetical protein